MCQELWVLGKLSDLSYRVCILLEVQGQIKDKIASALSGDEHHKKIKWATDGLQGSHL